MRRVKRPLSLCSDSNDELIVGSSCESYCIYEVVYILVKICICQSIVRVGV